jgi:CDP-diacylglycerol--glycerol-3-phosphate 3-phosphatidyltransferase
MTTANKVTILRILLIPFFVLEVLYYVKNGRELHRVLALGTFATAAICDALDGFIARRFNQRSDLGTILDPLADKLLLVSGIVVLSFDRQPYLQSIPLAVAVTIIGRDILVVIGLGVVHVTVGKVIVRPHVLGKLATVFQMLMVVGILLKVPDHWMTGLFYAAAICTGLSGLLYLLDGMKQLSAHPSSNAKPKT